MTDLFDMLPEPEPQEPVLSSRPWMKKGVVYTVVVAVSEDKKTLVVQAPPEVWEYLNEVEGSITELGLDKEQEATPGIYLADITYSGRYDYEGEYDDWTNIVRWEKINCPQADLPH